MRIDELQRGLASARDEQVAADPLAGRQGVDRHVRRQRFERAGLAALIIVLLAGAAVFVATRGADEQRVISGPGAVPHYLPDPLLPGAVFLQEFPADPTGTRGISAVVETVVWTNAATATPEPGTPVVLLEVATGARADASLDNPVSSTAGGLTQSRWSDGEGHVFTVRSVGIAPEVVDEIRASQIVDEQDHVVVNAPLGFREVARDVAVYDDVDPAAMASISVFGTFVAEARSGYVAIFNDAGDGVRPSFSASKEPRSGLWFVLASPQHGFEKVELRGRVGYRWQITGVSQSASSGGDRREVVTSEGTMFFWWESDDQLLATLGPTESESLALAESLRVVDDAAWQRFVDTASPMLSLSEPTSQTFSSVGSAISGTTVP